MRTVDVQTQIFQKQQCHIKIKPLQKTVTDNH